MVQRGPTELEHVQADISALVSPYPFLWYRVSCLALCLKASGKVTNLAWESVFPLLGESSEPVFAYSLEEYSPEQGIPTASPTTRCMLYLSLRPTARKQPWKSFQKEFRIPESSLGKEQLRGLADQSFQPRLL